MSKPNLEWPKAGAGTKEPDSTRIETLLVIPL